jgi:hypothetical protein
MVRTDSGTDAGAPSAIGLPGTVVVVVDDADELPHPARSAAVTPTAHAVVVHLPNRRIALPRTAPPAEPTGEPPDRTTAPP